MVTWSEWLGFSQITNLYFSWRTENKKNPASVYRLKSLTNAKIHIFNYAPHKKIKKLIVYFWRRRKISVSNEIYQTSSKEINYL